jgi:hypothetical protein
LPIVPPTLPSRPPDHRRLRLKSNAPAPFASSAQVEGSGMMVVIQKRFAALNGDCWGELGCLGRSRTGTGMAF